MKIKLLNQRKLLPLVLSVILSFSISISYAQRGSHHSTGSSYHSSGTSHHTSGTYHRSSTSKSYYSSTHASTGQHRSTYSTSAKRDSHGRIARSSTARERFMRQTGYPHGRPGYVIDHVKPLSEGGADDPSNMQWQTKEDAAAKDKWERKK
jgi:hypothetical protein